MKFQKGLVILAVAIAIGAVIGYFTLDDVTVLGDLTFASLAGISVVLTWFAKNRAVLPEEKKTWSLLFYAAALLFLGEVCWTYGEVIRGINLPSPSLVDVFWVAGHILIIYALWTRMRVLFEPMHYSVLAMVVGFTAFAAVLISFLEVVSVDHSLKTWIDFSYPFMDVVTLTLLTLIVLPLLMLKNKILIRPWLFLSVAFGSFIVYDLAYAYLRFFGLYFTGSLIDITYIAGYMFWCVAAFMKKPRGVFHVE